MDIKMKPTRDGYGEGLLILGETNKDVIVMDADVAKSTRTDWFQQRFPDKFFDMGISEQDMLGTAAGLSLGGKIPFVSTYGVFLSGRAWDQIRTTICYMNLNVKLGGAHGGISVGPDGATHQALEEVSLMRVLPNMTVIVPCDSIETKKAVIMSADHQGPCYIRFGREAVPIITDENTPFEIGKVNILKIGTDVTIFANGPMVYEAMLASDELEKEKISASVINLHTVKPIDKEAIINAAVNTGAVVTAEEHQIAGGMGSAVCEILAQYYPVPVEMIGIKDSFGESGTPDELMEKYNLKSKNILLAAKRVISRKR